MNDVQMQMMSLQRHHAILARVHAQEAAAAKPAPAFAEALESAAPTVITPPAPAAEPARTLALSNPPATAAVPQLSPAQAALLAASLGITPSDESATAPIVQTAAAGAVPDMSDDQMSALMSAFGHEAAPAQVAANQGGAAYPQTAAAMAATAIPLSQGDNLRYFPINRAAQSEAHSAAAQASASDTYLRAMQQMERNLGAYGGLTANGR